MVTIDPASSGPTFSASLEQRDGESIVHVFGEVDIATAPLLSEQLDEARRQSGAGLVIDLGSVTLLDSSGLAILIEELSRLRAGDEPGATLRLVVSEPQVQRVFSITGLDGLFQIFPTLEEALGAPR